MKRLLRYLLAGILAVIAILWRLTVRIRVIDETRPVLRQAQQPYIYAILHAHQLAAVFANDEPGIWAMVSRSGDGDLLVPLLRFRRVKAVRGSTRKGGVEKGGADAFRALAAGLERGVPVLFAVDGPRGPRNKIHRGVAALALETGTPIVPACIVSSSKWILSRTWDRFQIPKPFSTVTLVVAPAIVANLDESEETLRERVGHALGELERCHDPHEFQATRV